MAIALAGDPDARRRRRAQGVLQLFFDNRIDDHPRPLPNHHLETAANDRGLGFCSRLVLGILRHRVILRHPPPSGRISCV
jgi:hypothetical protein